MFAGLKQCADVSHPCVTSFMHLLKWSRSTTSQLIFSKIRDLTAFYFFTNGQCKRNVYFTNWSLAFFSHSDGETNSHGLCRADWCCLDSLSFFKLNKPSFRRKNAEHPLGFLSFTASPRKPGNWRSFTHLPAFGEWRVNGVDYFYQRYHSPLLWDSALVATSSLK